MLLISAASGKVINQAVKISTTVFHRQDLLTRPMPIIDPHATCVVETGIPAPDANNTRKAVIKLAQSPWPVDSSVIPLLIVSATRRELRIPPIHMARPTSAKPHDRLTVNALVTSNRAAILGALNHL